MTAMCVDDLLGRIKTLEAELAYYKGKVFPKVVTNEGQSVIAVGRTGSHLSALRIGNYWTGYFAFEPWMETAPPVPYDQSRYLDIRAYFDKEDDND